jgi:DNA-binding MarR family transcriptional regulator
MSCSVRCLRAWTFSTWVVAPGSLQGRWPSAAPRLVQEQIDAGHLRRGADQGDGRVSLISFTETGREYAETVKRTLEESIKKFFVDPLDDEDIAALTTLVGCS